MTRFAARQFPAWPGSNRDTRIALRSRGRWRERALQIDRSHCSAARPVQAGWLRPALRLYLPGQSVVLAELWRTS